MLNEKSLPLLSVVVPVHNGAVTLDRALRSVTAQTFCDWEVVAVDDASNDESPNVLQRWAIKETRIRLIRLDENCGVSTARNVAIQNARGRLVSYLDQDDEYYPDYLASVVRLGDTADVLMFRYDFVYEDSPAGPRPPGWDPGRLREFLFAKRIVTPLGVAHRREWWQKVGGFNEAWCEEDSDLWRRMARAGAKFSFPPLASGRCHVHPDRASRMSHVTPRQREMFLENWQAGRPIYEDGNGKPGISNRKLQDSSHPNPLPQAGEGTRKVAFVSPHCVIDFTNGAATATLDGLQVLQGLGFQCQAFCSTRLDSWEEVLVEEVLARRGVRYEVRNVRIGPHQGRMIFTTHEKIPVTLFNSASTRGGWINDEEIATFLTACEIFLTKNHPDVVWTYGGDPVSCAVQQLVKRLDIPIVFALHNFGYRDAGAFQTADYVIVPTDFCRQHYWDAIGLASLKLPLVVDPERVQLADRRPEYVTFVNPEPRKGIHVFARIAEVLSQRRPDIPLLLVEGAVKASFLPELGIDLSGAKNLRIMPNTPDARQFLAATKILLMPSLMENAALVAMEAMLNGIPVLASNRGGLPETIGDAGFLFDIPAKYTPETREMPTAEEVEPWVETIIRLWDDAAEYECRSQAARARSQLWHPDQVGPIYREFFSSITHQPGPPLVPQWVTGQSAPAVVSASAVVVANRVQMIMRFPRGAVVAEIGVDQGVFSRSILRTNPRRLHLIDPWEKQTGDFASDPMNDGDFEQKYTAVREALGPLPNVEIIRDYSLKAVERFADGYFDWIYLDADHSYRAVRSDLEAWIRKIRPGGIFAGHDYCTRQWIQVKAALDDFLRTSGRRLDYLTSDDVFLSWGFIV